jgi:hypothetical protein
MTYPLPYKVLLDQIDTLYWVSSRTNYPDDRLYDEMIYGRLTQVNEEDYE